MAKTLSAPVSLLASTVTAGAAGTKGAPGGAGAWVDISAYDGGDVHLAIQNAASAPGVAGQILIQASPDNGTNITDYWGFGGDTAGYAAATLAGLVTNTIKIDSGIKYIRVIGWGHTTNSVTYTGIFVGVTRS